MQPLQGSPKFNDWGATDLIPNFLGTEPTGDPFAELWFGAHPMGPALLENGESLRDEIAASPGRYLGPSTRFSLGDELPYLVKLIAPAASLSIQVHPGRMRSARGFELEEASDVPFDSPLRTFHDPTHKPEMIYALTEYEGLVGFATTKRIRERLDRLDSKIADRLVRRLRLATGRGIRPVVGWILEPEDGPSPGDVIAFVDACKQRLENGISIEPALDRITVGLLHRYGPDPAILIAYLMNYVCLQPGEAVFIDTGVVHAYQNGLGLEVMANSDNVIRAGLTSKHVAADLFMEVADFEGKAPVRIAPEHPIPGVDLFRSPVEDFELITASPTLRSGSDPLPLPGSGPRIALCLDDRVKISTRNGELELGRGQAAFLLDEDGQAVAQGPGRVAVCAVP